VFLVLGQGLFIYQNVIKENQNKFSQVFRENIVHELLLLEHW
jgi:hypothetical protein